MPSIIYRFFSFFFSCYGDHRDLHSFPTRRSSDLTIGVGDQLPLLASHLGVEQHRHVRRVPIVRSEEHTSELQSHSDLVCRLLLEKKKNSIYNQSHGTHNGPNSTIYGTEPSPRTD